MQTIIIDSFSCFYLFCPIPIYFILYCFIIISWKSAYFLVRDKNGVDPDGRGGGEILGGVEGRETTIRIYLASKNLFSKTML